MITPSPRPAAPPMPSGVWATFLQSVGGGASGGITGATSQSYSVDTLETQYLLHEPSEADLAQRVAEPAVQAAINAGLFGRRPVYMITGVKIARGLNVSSSVDKGWNVGLDGSVPVAESVGVSVGGEVAVERRGGISTGFRIADGEDVLFAYQVHVIRIKGRKGKETMRVGVWESDAALLHEDDGGTMAEVDVQPASPEDLREGLEEEDFGTEVESVVVKEVEEDGEILTVMVGQ